MKTTYLHDQIEGIYLIYGLKGNVEVSGSYLHSNKSATWVYFNDEGVLLKKEEYENGRLVKQEIMEEEK
jgi:antitoxin component YwqK of YwqJK toxin-antitoxin module